MLGYRTEAERDMPFMIRCRSKIRCSTMINSWCSSVQKAAKISSICIKSERAEIGAGKERTCSCSSSLQEDDIVMERIECWKTGQRPYDTAQKQQGCGSDALQ